MGFLHQSIGFSSLSDRDWDGEHDASDTEKIKTGMRDSSKAKSKNEEEWIDQDYAQFSAALIHFSLLFLFFSRGSESDFLYGCWFRKKEGTIER